MAVDRYRQAEVAGYTGSRTIGQHGGYRKTANIMDGDRPFPDTVRKGMVYLHYTYDRPYDNSGRSKSTRLKSVSSQADRQKRNKTQL